MLNIELHGLDLGHAAELRRRIIMGFGGKPYESEYVVTIVNDAVIDSKHNSQPFIRIFSDENPHIDDVVKELEECELNIEVSPLTAFHPRRK